MADTLYFSDRELGPKPREEQDTTPKAWGGIVAITHSLISTGALAIDFPKYGCEEAQHYVPREPAKGGYVVLRDPAGKGPNLSLDQARERRTEKRSRRHVDLYTNKQESEMARLVKIGAVRYPWKYRPGDGFVVLADPDDNLFSVVRVRGEI
jgi:Glyoxalase-like domain